MSLLRRGTQVVTIFPQETVTDQDGNTKTRPSAVGVVARAVVQPMPRFDGAEDWNGGYLTESRYRLRLAGWQGEPLGALSQVVWQGRRYAVHGEPKVYTDSPQTSHISYVIERR